MTTETDGIFLGGSYPRSGMEGCFTLSGSEGLYPVDICGGGVFTLDVSKRDESDGGCRGTVTGLVPIRVGSNLGG